MAIRRQEALVDRKYAAKWVWSSRRRFWAAVFVLAIAGGTSVVWTQAPALPASAVSAAAPAAGETEPAPLNLLVGRSTVLDVPGPVTRVSLTSADVADVLVTSPSQLLINGKLPGTISMFVWERSGSPRRYEVVVQRDLTRLNEQLKQLLPGERIDVQTNGRNIVLSGKISSKDVGERAVSVAAGYVDKREEVVSLLQLQDDAPSNQVLLRVRFAEVSRSALTELGASYFTSPTGVENTVGRLTTQQFPSVGYDGIEYTKSSSDFGSAVTSAQGKFTFSDFLNLFLFNEKYDLGVMVKMLQTKGLFQSLAEPNLVAESGKEASFLAGGEFPIPVAQGSGANIGVSVVFKEFGIRLTFTPVVTGDRIHLKVRPEVSTLDFSNAVVFSGFRIPALSTRRTETELELGNRQTFAIAGLLNNTMNSTLQKVPGIGDIPILGQLFRSKAAQKNQTELVVMITPEILPNNSRGVTPNLPRAPEPFMPPVPENQSVEPPPPAFGGQNPAAVSGVRAADVRPAAPVAASPAAGAAATVSALTPGGPRPTQRTNPAAPAGAPASQPAAAATPAVSAATGSSPSAVPTAAPAAAPNAAAARQLTDQERKIIERARQQEQDRLKADAKRQAEQAAVDRRQAEKEQELQRKQAEEQAKRDREEAKRLEEARKKQAELDRERQKAIDEANAKIQEAQARYEAELAKQNKK
jgi:pilus assembly protein CpaC